MPRATNRAWSEFQKASRSLESPPPHSYHLFLIVRLAVEKKREKRRRIQASGKYIGCKCILPRVLCRWTRAQDEDEDDDEDEHESSAPDRDIQLFLFPFTSVYVPRSLFAWTKYGHASTTPRYMCADVTCILTHTYTHTHMRSPHISCRRKAYNDFLFRKLERPGSSSVRRKKFHFNNHIRDNN